MKDSKRRGINRRGFLKGAAVGAAGLVAQTPEIKAQQVQTARGAAALPSARALAAETEPVATDVDVLTADHPGSDFMVDVTLRRTPARVSEPCTNPSSTTAATRIRSC